MTAYEKIHSIGPAPRTYTVVPQRPLKGSRKVIAVWRWSLNGNQYISAASTCIFWKPGIFQCSLVCLRLCLIEYHLCWVVFFLIFFRITEWAKKFQSIFWPLPGIEPIQSVSQVIRWWDSRKTHLRRSTVRTTMNWSPHHLQHQSQPNSAHVRGTKPVCDETAFDSRVLEQLQRLCTLSAPSWIADSSRKSSNAVIISCYNKALLLCWNVSGGINLKLRNLKRRCNIEKTFSWKSRQSTYWLDYWPFPKYPTGQFATVSNAPLLMIGWLWGNVEIAFLNCCIRFWRWVVGSSILTLSLFTRCLTPAITVLFLHPNLLSLWGFLMFGNHCPKWSKLTVHFLFKLQIKYRLSSFVLVFTIIYKHLCLFQAISASFCTTFCFKGSRLYFLMIKLFFI